MIKFIRQTIENNPKIIYYFYIINKKKHDYYRQGLINIVILLPLYICK